MKILCLVLFLAGMAAFVVSLWGTSFEKIQREAEEGKPTAQYKLGYMYMTGTDVPRDDAKAFFWFKKSAEQGFCVAQHYLGTMYIEGRGMKEDFALARQWLEKAAAQGYSPADRNLGFLYAEGKGGPKDIAAALEWFETAYRKDNKEGCERSAQLSGAR